jgi:hypothetical protein
MDTPTRELLNPRKLRQTAIIDVALSEGRYVKARKLDLSVMLFEGLLPMSMLGAAQKFTQRTASADPLGQLTNIEDTDRAAFMTVLRKHATVAVVEPKLVLVDDGNPDHLPVELLTLTDLMAIWTATAISPVLDPDAAAEFRRQPAPDVDPALQLGEDVRPTAEPVAERSVVGVSG